MAQEGVGKGVTVNAIAPGYIDTDMVRAVPEDVLKKIVARIPVGRLGKADEIARGVLFLVADDAGFITRSEEHTSELQSLMRISYAVFCLKKKKNINTIVTTTVTINEIHSALNH